MSEESVDRAIRVIRNRDRMTAMLRKETKEEICLEAKIWFSMLTPTEALHFAKELQAEARDMLRRSITGE